MQSGHNDLLSLVEMVTLLFIKLTVLFYFITHSITHFAMYHTSLNCPVDPFVLHDSHDRE